MTIALLVFVGKKVRLPSLAIGTADFVSELQAAPLVDIFSKTPSHFLEVKFLLLRT